MRSKGNGPVSGQLPLPGGTPRNLKDTKMKEKIRDAENPEGNIRQDKQESHRAKRRDISLKENIHYSLTKKAFVLTFGPDRKGEQCVLLTGTPSGFCCCFKTILELKKE